MPSMRITTRATAILLAALMAGGAAISASAQTTAPAQTAPGATQQATGTAGGSEAKATAPRQERDGRHAERGRGDHHGERHGKRGGRHEAGPRVSPARVAAMLATLETGIGITPDQLGPWRAFTAAAIDFADASKPVMRGAMRGPGGRGADAGGAGEEGGARLPAFRMLDAITDHAIARGQSARTLKAALTDLRQTLTPKQVETAQTLVRSMMREIHEDRRGGRRGGEHHRRHHEGHGERHGRG